jgi:hypothetical protein
MPQPAAKRPAPPEPESIEPEMGVEESSIDLSALGFDPALLLKKPAAPPPDSQATAGGAAADRPLSEPERPELLWSDMELNDEEEDEDPPLFRPEDEPTPRPIQLRREDPQQADTQKLSLAEVSAAAAAARAAAASMGQGRKPRAQSPVESTAPVSEAAQRARVLRAQGKMVEARHMLHRHLREAPHDRAADEEFRRIQQELRQSCLAQLRNEELIPQLQLPPGSAQHQALLAAPAGGVLRRVNGSMSLREIRIQMQITHQEFERQMCSLMEWGFVSLSTRRR